MATLKNKTIRLNSEIQNIFFTSDNHFMHFNVIEYCNRPFESSDQMSKVMIQNWNSVVGKEDIIFILGDFCFSGSAQWSWLLDTLNGTKYLVWGNHDKGVPSTKFERMDNIINLLILDPEIKDGQRISLCHYPMLSWYQSHKGSWQLFGHVHGKLSNKSLADDGFDITKAVTPRQLDVGVDVHDFTPISYQEVKTIITKQCLK